MDCHYVSLWTLLASFVYLPHCFPSLINTKEIIEETCNLETFSPKCSSSQRIFITQSHYGHMKMGKCVTFDTGHLGCMADVIGIAQQRCNGKSRCQIAATDAEIAKTQPCAQGIYTYLENAYACVPDWIKLDQCTKVAADRQWKYIVSTSIDQHCLQQSEPLRVTVSPSMDIEISAKIINEATLDMLNVYVSVVDIHGNTTRLEMSRTSTYAQRIFESSEIHILFAHSEAFLLFAVRAVGCEDLMAPEFTWIERLRNMITIGCIHNEYIWQVKCIGSKWIGFRGNCTKQTETQPAEERPHEVEREGAAPKQTIFTKGIQYTLTIGITVLLCVVVITTGFVCLRKAEYKAKASKGMELQEMTGDYSNTWKATLMRPATNDLNNPNASPQQFYVLNQQTDTPIGTLR